jgi:hypothetical protein
MPRFSSLSEPGLWRPPAAQYLMALLGIAAATVVRLPIEPILEGWAVGGCR